MCPLVSFKIIALAGNRTPVSRVAGENSTTEPPMLTKLGYPACNCINRGVCRCECVHICHFRYGHVRGRYWNVPIIYCSNAEYFMIGCLLKFLLHQMVADTLGRQTTTDTLHSHQSLKRKYQYVTWYSKANNGEPVQYTKVRILTSLQCPHSVNELAG